LILRHSAISGFFPLLRGKKYIKLQLVEILLIRKRSGTAWTPSILGPPVRTQTSHKGTPNTSLHLAYNLETAYGARARKHNWNSGVLGRARAIPKQWSIHSGTTSAHTKQSFWDHKCAHKSFTEEPGIQTSLTLAYQPTTSDGARVEPIFLHLKRWQEGTSDTKKELYYQGGHAFWDHQCAHKPFTSGTPSTPVLDLRHTSAYNWPTTNGTQVHQFKKKLERALAIPKRNGTTWSTRILGPQVRTQTFHRGTPNTEVLGPCFQPNNSPRGGGKCPYR
jgi:hypothetical protein